MAYDTTERIGRRVKNITADIKRYLGKKIELFAITAGEHYSEFTAKSLQKGAGLCMLGLAFIFLLVALAEFIGALLESQPLGYVIVAVPLILIGYLLYNLKPQSFNRMLQNELEEDFVRLLNKYEKKTDQRLSVTQAEQTLKEKESDGSE